ncbi:MAG TPA: hypothetical protein VJ691_06305 [Vicinamibacterales bacterium]|nr:hypothetical protein [Vicinamibacterales bacterium]
MILNPGGTIALSSMGWVDHDAIWSFDAAAGTSHTIQLKSGAEHCSLHAKSGDRFAVAHHFAGRRFELTVHDFSTPDAAIARVVVSENQSALTGTSSALADVPSLYVTYLAFEPWRDYVLVEIDGEGGLTIHRLPWYDTSYDKDYQAIVDAVAIPGQRQALISVQRSSRLVVQDLESGDVVQTLNLGGGAGNPRLTVLDAAAEIWTTDYDSVAVVRTDRLKVRKRVRLQGAAQGTQLFVGDLSFAPHRDACIVPRPFSHDVVALDLVKLKVQGTATVGREPLEAALLANGDVIARDWKTGDLLRATLGGKT